jgi:hypothetical protein
VKNASPEGTVPHLIHNLLGGDAFIEHTSCVLIMASGNSVIYRLPMNYQVFTYLSITLVDFSWYSFRLLKRPYGGGKMMARVTRTGIDPDDLANIISATLNLPLLPRHDPALHQLD